MKKVVVAVAMIFGLGSSVAFAQEVKESTEVAAQQTTQDEFVKIDSTALPKLVQDALAKKYEGASVKEAYEASRAEGKVYKVVLITKDEKEVTALLDDKGEAVKE